MAVKKFLLITLTIVFVTGLIFSGCVETTPSPAPTSSADIKIGLLYPLTGPAAVIGEFLVSGGEFAFEEVGYEVAGKKIEVIVEDYAEKIRKAREKLGLKQKDFAKKISERASLVHNFETGKIEPSLKIAQKLEKMLKIKLIEEIEEKPEKIQKTKSEEFTVGDFIKVKK